MRYYIILPPTENEQGHEISTRFYTGSGKDFSSEYPNAQLYRTRGDAYVALRKARMQFPNSSAELTIVDSQDHGNDGTQDTKEY